MAFWNRYPYTDMNQLNLDWILSKIGLVDKAKVDAEAAKDAAESAKDAAVSAQEAAEAAQDGAETAETNTRSMYNRIGGTVAPQVTSWLEANVDPVGSAVTVDKSLSIEGSAADAKMTGDAIRGITGYNTISLSDWVSGEYISDQTGEVLTEGGENWKRTDYIEIFPDQAKLAITTSSLTGAVIYNAYYDEDKVFIDNFNLPQNTSAILTPPDDAKYIRMSCTSASNVDVAFDYYSIDKFGQLSRNANQVTDLNDVIISGNYILWANRSYTNAPAGFETGAKNLQVIIDRYDPNYIIQILACTPNTEHDYISFMRVSSNNGQTWKNWFKVVDNRHIDNNLYLDDTIASVSSQGNNTGDKLTVSSYNVAHFNNDTQTYIPNIELKNMRNVLNHIDADILCTQEDDLYIDAAEQKESNAYLYYPKYANRTGDNGTVIHSKLALASQGVLKFTNNQLLRYATVNIGSKILLVLSVHAIWNYNNTGGESTESINSRDQQFTEMFNWISGSTTLPNYADNSPVSVPAHTHTIIGMDGNTTTLQDRTNISNLAASNNFILGNGGYLGWILTCDLDTSTPSAIDNILVSDNIIINKFIAHSEYYADLYSDHVPVSADITLL